MRTLFTIAISAMSLCSLKSYAQECFAEKTTVATLACTDAQMGFNVNKTATSIDHQSKIIFTIIDDEGKNVVVPSWFMMAKSGPQFNIHQYGFMKGDTEIVVIYKVLEKNNRAEVAIMVAKSPFYHGYLNIEQYKESDIYTTGETEGAFKGAPLKFMLMLNNKSQLQGFSIGGNTISLHI